MYSKECQKNEVLSDVNQGTKMTDNGWVSNVTSFNSNYEGKCGTQTWFGWWGGSPVGAISSTLKGSGMATLVFGNCNSVGYVSAYLNDKVVGKAKASIKKMTVAFDFSKGDVLTVAEFETSIIKLNAIAFKC